MKLDLMEFEYEGPEEFLRTELFDVLETFSQLSARGFNPNDTSTLDTEIGSDTVSDAASNGGAGTVRMATDNIAAKLNVKTGPDLAMAACAHLTLTLGKSTFSRKEILQDMQSASGYYKDSHGKNMTSLLRSLIRDNKVVKRSEDSYALPANQRQRLEAELAEQ